MDGKLKLVRLRQCEKIAKNLPGKLSHYTSVDVLCSILKNKEIWLGSTRCMNDISELSFFIDKLKEYILQVCDDEEKKKRTESFFEKIHQRLLNEYPYALCLSKKEDDASQWERYAGNAQGVCIVFNTKKLINLFYGGELYFTKVQYNKNIKKHPHYNNIVDYIKYKKVDGFESEGGLIDNIIASATSYKHKSFNSEGEVRMCSLLVEQNYLYREEIRRINGIVKTFLILNIEEYENLYDCRFVDAIEKIYIGPRSIQQINDLIKYLEQIGYPDLTNKIEKSKCPLRWE